MRRSREMQPVASEAEDSPGEFTTRSKQLYDHFADLLSRGQSPQTLLDSHNDCVYAKNPEGLLVFANRRVQELFGGRTWLVGLCGDSFLCDEVAAVAQMSDSLVSTGCRHLEFEHGGTDVRGRALVLRTFKCAAVGLESHRVSVFGVTRVIRVEADVDSSPERGLWDSWQAFQTLRPQEIEVAVRMIRGEKIRDIASDLSVAPRTVDNRRAAILRKLEVANSCELAVLMVRLQDGGYINFGI